MLGLTLGELSEILASAAVELWEDYADDKRITADELLEVLWHAADKAGEVVDSEHAGLFAAVANLFDSVRGVLEHGKIELQLGPADWLGLAPSLIRGVWASYREDHRITASELLELGAHTLEELSGEADEDGAQAMMALADLLRRFEAVMEGQAQAA